MFGTCVRPQIRLRHWFVASFRRTTLGYEQLGHSDQQLRRGAHGPNDALVIPLENPFQVFAWARGSIWDSRGDNTLILMQVVPPGGP